MSGVISGVQPHQLRSREPSQVRLNTSTISCHGKAPLKGSERERQCDRPAALQR